MAREISGALLIIIRQVGATLTLMLIVITSSSCSAMLDTAPRLSEPLVAWGDSLTYSLTKVDGAYSQASPTWLETVGADLGVDTRNFGVPTQGSAEIAVRQGGLKPVVTIRGGKIPAYSTAEIAVEAINPSDGWTQVAEAGTMKMHGRLAGLSGTLMHTVKRGVGSFSFVPDTASPSVVPVPSNSVFNGDNGLAYRGSFQFIWAGANNAGQTAEAVRDIAMMVRWLIYPRQYLVIGMIPEIADDLTVAYGPRFVDLRSWLIADGLAVAGVAETDSDARAIAAGEIPPSLMVDDGIHFTQAAYTAIGHHLASVVKKVS